MAFLVVVLIQAGVPTCPDDGPAPGLCSEVGRDVWFAYAWISAILPVVALVLARRISRVPQDRVRRAVAVPLILTGAHVAVVAILFVWLT